MQPLLPLLILNFLLFCWGEEDDCAPALADRCFSQFTIDLIHSINSSNSDGQATLCNSSLDYLNCARDIIDTDCNVKDGRANFDQWLQALLTVQNYMCYTSPDSLKEILQELAAENICWNLFEFWDCVEQKAQVTHVVDMLKVMLDQKECTWLLIVLSACNMQAMKSSSCEATQMVVSELVHIFMLEANCKPVCSISVQKSAWIYLIFLAHSFSLSTYKYYSM